MVLKRLMRPDRAMLSITEAQQPELNKANIAVTTEFVAGAVNRWTD